MLKLFVISRPGAALLACLGACLTLPSCATPSAFSPPPNLTTRINAAGRCELDGRPLLAAATTTVIPLDPRHAVPVLTVWFARHDRADRYSGRSLIASAGDFYFDLPARVSDRLRPLVWSESRGRVHTWPPQAAAAGALGVVGLVEFVDVVMHAVPVVLGSGADSQSRPVLLGIRTLALFDAAEFDWERRKLILSRSPPGVGSPAGEDDASRPGVPIRWWRPFGDEPARGHGCVSVEAAVDGRPVRVVLDTAQDADLILPRTLARTEPWSGRLSNPPADAGLPALGAEPGASLHILGGEFRIGGAAFHNLTVEVFDDSTFPAAAEPMARAGARLLRRFRSLTLDFKHERVVFEQAEPPVR